MIDIPQPAFLHMSPEEFEIRAVQLDARLAKQFGLSLGIVTEIRKLDRRHYRRMLREYDQICLKLAEAENRLLATPTPAWRVPWAVIAVAVIGLVIAWAAVLAMGTAHLWPTQ